MGQPDVAIVGIGGVFPDAHDVDQFWENIVNRLDCARDVPDNRWRMTPDNVFRPEIAAADHVYSRRACLIDELPVISTKGLSVSAEFVAALDPAHRLLLHAGSKAFRDAKTENLDRSRIGVIIGNLALPSEHSCAIAQEYLGRSLEEKVIGHSRIEETRTFHPLDRYVTGLPAGVLARALGLGGGGMTLDAACSSSLYALKLAVDELTSGRADAMLTGGLSRPDSLYTQMGFSQLRALSPSGTCSPFDERGDGLVVGEGCGILVLKRLDDAVRDADRIYAVIKGIGLSNDVGGSLLAPMTEGQLRAMRAAYAQAGVAPNMVDLIECHATGTPLGDAVEVESLRSLWGADQWEPAQCVIGSVKSNVGHLLTAAGAAALIKTIKAIQNKTLPPTANFQGPAPGLGLRESPFTVLTKSKPWTAPSKGGPRYAAVSAFGFGGINAHVVLEEWRAPQPPASGAIEITKTPRKRQASDIAVVGMDAYFGPWTSLRAFQERVFGAGIDSEPHAPESWWGVEDTAWFRLQGLNHVPFKGHFLDEIEIPLQRFRIPPKELSEMLPQQLLMLRVAAAALEDAGHVAGERRGDADATGVFVGIGLDLNTTNFSFRWSLIEKAKVWSRHLGLNLSDEELEDWVRSLRDAAGPPLTANRTMGALGSIVASRIAREFQFGGPSFTISSEETSGVRALEMAVRNLQRRTIDRALVGAVDMAGDVRAMLTMHAGRAFSSSGVCRPFDEKADGAVVGEGATAVVLKRAEDALRDGDRIYAVIKGIGVATGGGLDDQVPTESAYLRAAERAAEEAGIDYSAVRFMEAHGSGCPEEDRMEARALARLFRKTAPLTRFGAGDEDEDVSPAADTPAEPLCLLSSVKADIGHTGAASGLASFVKSCLCLYQQLLPPLRHFDRSRPELAGAGHRLHTLRYPQYWLRNRADGPVHAAVSAFSIDGNCAHVILESNERQTQPLVQTERLQPLGLRNEALFLVEANNVQALDVGIGRLRAHAEHDLEKEIEVCARQWWHENRADPSKSLGLAFVARSVRELLMQIDFVQHVISEDPGRRFNGRLMSGVPPYVRDRVFFSPEPIGREGKLAFVYPGSGNQYIDMGRDFAVQWPEIYRKQDAESEHLFSQFLPDLFWNTDQAAVINQNHKAALFGQVALGAATTDVIQSFGVRPDAVIGYSLGETAGLFAMRAWTDRDLMLKRINESTLFTEDLAGEYKAARRAWKLPSTKTVDWALGVIDRPAKVARAALKDHKKVYTLIVNTLHECVIGGDPHAVEKLVKKLDCEFFPLHGVTTVHCEVAKEVQEPYRELHVLPTTPPRDVRFYSGAWGTAYNLSSERAADSVLAQAIYGIDYPKVIESAYDDGARLFIEMGPGGSCTRMIGEILGDRAHVARTVCTQGQDAVSTVLRLLGQLLAERVPVDLSVLYGQETRVALHGEPPDDEPSMTVPVGGLAFQVVLPKRRDASVARTVPPPAIEAPPAAPVAPSTTVAPAVKEFFAPELPAVPAYEPVAGSVPVDSLLQGWKSLEEVKAEAHENYLRFAQTTSQTLSDAIAVQMAVLESAAAGASVVALPIAPPPEPPDRRPADEAPAVPVEPVALDRGQCMEFAVGSIAKVLGPEFAPVDSHPTRVRLPDEPLMLVDRILSIDGVPRSMSHGRVVTEHDIHPAAWYLDCGRIPTCIAVEAGQADLFLSGYLGIDFETKGRAVYRLLDAIVTFHRGLPQPGETIHYDIRIERFFRQGDTYLFRFNFDASVSGQPLLTMREGCAGFFTREELDAGAGIVKREIDQRPMQGARPADWTDLVPMAVESYTAAQLNALRTGDLAACFGEAFEGLAVENPVTLPGGRMKLVDRITRLDPNGGRFGLGIILGEMDVHPDDWFLTCHFVDDQVMPGTLMYECCLHTLRVFLLRMGWVAETGRVAYEPVKGVSGRLKCRGEVNESTDKVTYEVTVKELGYNPNPYAIADTVMYVDGKPAIEMNDMSIQLTGVERSDLEAGWQNAGRRAPAVRTALFDRESIMAYAEGKPSEAFGDRYAVFDEGRVLARLPRPPYSFMDRVVAVDCEQWVMKPGGTIEAEYDVPPDEWYFGSNRLGTMPFAVLLEVALQPCGWFAAYMGSALTSNVDLRFRNLGGRAVQHLPVTPDIGTVTTRVKCTDISSSGGMIIQSFDYEVRSGRTLVYSGDTYFGFFSADALADQIGIRDAKLYDPGDAELSVNAPHAYPTGPPYPDDTMRMVSRIDVFDPKGGPNGLGFIRGSIPVDPGAWFFRAHFYQDPVWPGSLGLEAFLQLLKHVAVERWAVGAAPHLEAVAVGAEHTWTYRGQILPTDKHVTIEAVVTEVDDVHQLLRADGHLTVDGRTIYQMKNFTARLTEQPG